MQKKRYKYSFKALHGDSRRMTKEMANKTTYNHDKTHYEFDWGYITEKKTESHIIWEYFLTEAKVLYLKAGRRGSDLQRTIFYELDKITEVTTRDITPILNIKDEWKVFQSNSEGTFYIITHISKEEEARAWSINMLISTLVPTVLSSIKNHECNAFLRT